ncbi:MAG: hypothetical protein ACXVCY_10335 [Pseudobdellovibrionaceae bacterium]
MKRERNLLAIIYKALFSFLITVLFFSPEVFAELGDSFILCKNNKSVRTLRVEMNNEGKCQAVYTKQGVDEIIGVAQDKNACFEIISNVRKKIEEKKWVCREVKDARVSNIMADTE